MRNLSKLILSLLLAFFGMSFSYDLNKLDPVLRMAVREDKKALTSSQLKVKSYDEEIRKVKVLTKDGKVKVVDLSERSLESLLKDDNIIYIKAPRKLKLNADITFKSSYAVWGTGNQEILVNYPGPFSGYVVGASSVLLSPHCQLRGLFFTCSSNARIRVSATGDYRLILSGERLNSIHISGGNAKYLVGTRTSQSGKTGKGVIVAIIDTGINFCHPAFRKEDGTTRILYFKSIDEDIGELNSEQINQRIAEGRCNYDFHRGHGTAVASIAGGYWSQSRFNSPAKDVSFIIYHIPIFGLSDIDVIEALEYIKEKAQSLNMPTVVNISIGFHNDPHDGRGLLDRKVDKQWIYCSSSCW